MKTSLPKTALFVLLAVLGTFMSPTADAARQPPGIPNVVITTAKPLSPH